MVMSSYRRIGVMVVGLGVWGTAAFAADVPTMPESAKVGTAVDVARFGDPIEGRGLGVQWWNPMDIHEVRVTGIPSDMVDDLRLEWWGSRWPKLGNGGWKRLDDLWNGAWARVDTRAVPGKQEGVYVFTFPPLTNQEFHRAVSREEYPDRKLPKYRKTMKVQVVTENGAAMPKGAKLMAFSGSTWREGRFDIDLRHNEDGVQRARLEVTNGYVREIASLPAPRDCTLEGLSWAADDVAGGSAGVRVDLIYVDNPDLNANAMTRVTVRLGGKPQATGFSFVPQDVLNAGAVRVPAFGALVAPSASHLSIANDPGPGPSYWDKPVRARIAQRPEMTRSAAMAGMPRLQEIRWVPLGVPSARQELFVDGGGNWSYWGMSLRRRFPEAFKAGKDSQRIPFRYPGEHHLVDKLYAMMDTRVEPEFDGGDREGRYRYLEEEHLPLIHAEWRTGPIRYHHQLGTTILEGDYGDDESRLGDETVVLLTRLDVRNTSDAEATATLNLRWSHNAELRLESDGIIAIEPPADFDVPEGLTPLRGQISMDEPVGGNADGWTIVPGKDPKCSAVLRWQAKLKPGQSRRVYFKMPYVHLLEGQEMTRLRQISYEKEIPAMLDYWRERIADGMRIHVPDPMVNSFYDANLWHIVITSDRDPITKLYNQGVATVRYGVYANETVMIARSLDMRGEHEEARRYLEPMIHFQGKTALTGRFSTKEGVFHGAGAYTHGEYAMNHGFTMWGIADHYLLTRDRAYLERVTPALLKACDFLINERQSTMTPPGELRTRYHGLAPACALEDVVEFKYWIATNAYYYLGFKRVAQALADVGHPRAAALMDEAEKYRADIEAAAREAATRSAVAQLRDGTFIPYVPSRVFQWRHLTEAWIREALYPALHLAPTEVVANDDPLITWMLDDLEDNIFFSRESGFDVDDVDDNWFELGGVTNQPCLVDATTIYMARNEIPAALRAFWNTYALSIYPDVHSFAEWARDFGVGGGPLYKTSDEARWVMWLRQLLIWEHDGQLWFARGVPREWLEDGKEIRVEKGQTYFGETNLKIHSEVAQGVIRATVDLPTDREASQIWLRLRHPQGEHPTRVMVNGADWPAERIVGEDILLSPANLDRSKPVNVVAHYER